MDKLITKSAPHTKLSPVHRVAVVPSRLHHRVSPDTQIESTAHSAVSTNGLHLPRWVVDFLGHKGCHRATLNTFTAGDANGFFERLPAKSTHLQVITPISHVNGIHAYYFPTCPDTNSTLDTLVGVKIKERVASVSGQFFGNPIQSVEALFIKTDPIDECL
jgi:hypothetical protein